MVLLFCDVVIHVASWNLTKTLIMEVHNKALKTLCRLCARKISKTGQKRPPKDCMEFQSKIWEFYGIRIVKSDFVPSKFCLKCYRRIINAKDPKVKSNDATDQQEIIKIQRINQIWMAHCDSSCIVCKLFKLYTNVGGNPTKEVSNIIDDLPNNYHDKLQQDSPPSTPVTTASHAKKPAECITSLQDPQLDLHDNNFKTPKKQKFSEMMTQTTPKQLLVDSLKRNSNSPLDKVEEKVNTHNMRRKLATLADGKTARCKTGGRVRMF